MTDLATRLLAERKAKGFSQEELAEKSGCSQQAIQSIEQRRQRRSSFVPALARILGVRAEWLADGTPPKLDGGVSDTHGNVRPAAPPRYLPVLSNVQAGAMTEVVSVRDLGDVEEYEVVASGPDLTDESFVLTIVGDSMLPDFKSGEKVVVTPGLTPKPGDFVVASMENGTEATFKQYRLPGTKVDGEPVIELVPLNNFHPTLTMDANTPGRIIGKVVRHIRVF